MCSFIFVILILFITFLQTAINQRIRAALNEHPTFTRMWKDILSMGKDESKNKKAKVLPRSGAILFSVQQVLIGCLLGYESLRYNLCVSFFTL